MVAHVATVAFLGLEPRTVEVQVQVSAGIPAFVMVCSRDLPKTSRGRKLRQVRLSER